MIAMDSTSLAESAKERPFTQSVGAKRTVSNYALTPETSAGNFGVRFDCPFPLVIEVGFVGFGFEVVKFYVEFEPVIISNDIGFSVFFESAKVRSKRGEHHRLTEG